MARKPQGDVAEEVERRLLEIEQLKQDAAARGLAFSAPTREQLEKKIRRETGQSPYIYSMSWTSGTSAGSPAYYNLYAANPDPTGYYPVFVTIFFGLANFFDDLSEAVDARDVRWPYVSSEPTYVAAGANLAASFSYTTPSGLPKGTYVANAVLWAGQYHDKGVYFDRGLFYVTLL
ncbi:MAG: hypothetical protein M3321_00655 [Actinomycetota bacterium]|nr:hypothetical protein [Actinomycetota bacterium]